MAKSDIWMPLYIGDYLADTMHLTTEQQGAYFLLLLYGWRSNGKIPSDDDSLAAITRLPLEKWKNNRPVIARFFQDGEFWTQARQLAEIEKAEKRRDAAKSNGFKGGRPKNNLQVSAGLGNGLANPNPGKSSLQSQSHIREEEDKSVRAPRFTPPTLQEVTDYCLERGKGTDPEKWLDHYTSNGWKVGRNPMKDWKAAVRNWEKGNQNGINGKRTGGYESTQEKNARRVAEYLGPRKTGDNQNPDNGFLSVLPAGASGHG